MENDEQKLTNDINKKRRSVYDRAFLLLKIVQIFIEAGEKHFRNMSVCPKAYACKYRDNF